VVHGAPAVERRDADGTTGPTAGSTGADRGGVRDTPTVGAAPDDRAGPRSARAHRVGGRRGHAERCDCATPAGDATDCRPLAGALPRSGLDGLLDEPRPGAPRTITDADVERIITRTLETRPADATHWSTRAMAKAEGLSQSAISRIWRALACNSRTTPTGCLGATRATSTGWRPFGYRWLRPLAPKANRAPRGRRKCPIPKW
jgi:Homeodomain-like domain